MGDIGFGCILADYQLFDWIDGPEDLMVFRALSIKELTVPRFVAFKRPYGGLDWRRLMTESRRASWLLHPNIVRTIDYGWRDTPYVVTDLVDGLTLRLLLVRFAQVERSFPLDLGLRIVIEVLRGLDYAHDATDGGGGPLHMIHRNIRPENIRLSRFREIKIDDFGLGWLANRFLENQEEYHDADEELAGCVRYMSPELAGRKDLDHRTDLFSVGAVLYEILTLEHLYAGDSGQVILRQVRECHNEGRLSQLPAMGARDALMSILQKALQPLPEDRYPSAAAMIDDLEAACMLLPRRPLRDAWQELFEVTSADWRPTADLRKMFRRLPTAHGRDRWEDQFFAGPFGEERDDPVETPGIKDLSAFAGSMKCILGPEQGGSAVTVLPPTPAPTPTPSPGHKDLEQSDDIRETSPTVPHGQEVNLERDDLQETADEQALPSDSKQRWLPPIEAQTDNAVLDKGGKRKWYSRLARVCKQTLSWLGSLLSHWPASSPLPPGAPSAMPPGSPPVSVPDLPPASPSGSPPASHHGRGKFVSHEDNIRDPVDCSVFAPPEVRAGSRLLVQVFVHLPDQLDDARTLASEFDAVARHRGATSLGTEIRKGDALTFECDISGAEIAEPVQHLIWRRRTNSVQFDALVHSGTVHTTLVGKIRVSQQSVPIGRVLFKVSVVETASPRSAHAQAIGAARRYSKAFISYAARDRREVIKRVQILSSVGIEYFQDHLGLDPGDRWTLQLFRHIDESDVMFLFWSSAARDSEWVTKEWKYGLKRKGDDFIRPVILEGPPPLEPPPELRHLHFSDRMLYFLVGGATNA